MSNEKMKVGLSFNGKSVEVELTQEQLKELGLIEEKKKTGYERYENGRKYYRINAEGVGACEPDWGHFTDNIRYGRANYYTNYCIAMENDRADTLMRQLRRFAAENGGIPSKEDWKDDNKVKYYIAYDYDDEDIFVNNVVMDRDSFQIYFNSREACEKAVEKFKKDLEWFFTMYQAQLY